MADTKTEGADTKIEEELLPPSSPPPDEAPPDADDLPPPIGEPPSADEDTKQMPPPDVSGDPAKTVIYPKVNFPIVLKAELAGGWLSKHVLFVIKTPGGEEI